MSAGYKLSSIWVLCVGDRLPCPDRSPQAEAQLFSEAVFQVSAKGGGREPFSVDFRTDWFKVQHEEGYAIHSSLLFKM